MRKKDREISDAGEVESIICEAIGLQTGDVRRMFAIRSASMFWVR